MPHRSHTARRRATPAALAAVAVLLCLSRPAPALINPNFTPANLIETARTVLHLEVGPPAGRAVPHKVVRARKGEAPAKLALVAADDEIADEFKAALKGRPAAAAVFFGGDFSKAAAAGGGAAGAGKNVGALLVGGTYFAVLQQEDGGLRLAKDPLALRTVWAGTAEMFLRLMDYLAADPSPTVPIASGAKWEREANLGKVAGRVGGCMAVELFGDGRPAVMVLSDAGDRLFRRSAAGAFEDATAAVKLTSRSTVAAVGDFTGDGRLDIASSDGSAVVVHEQAADGTFAARPVPPAPTGAAAAVRSLAAIGVGDARRAGLLVGTAGGAELLIPGDAGTFARKPLAAGPDAGGGHSVAADFDADGAPDVLRFGDKGTWFHKGTGPGTFAAPTAAGGNRVAGVAGATIGDFDADGLLDVFVAGSGGSGLYLNTGSGTFVEQVQESGEVGYDDKLDAAAATVVDVNNDGRLDLFVAFPNKLPFAFFNRGFCTFGVANDLLLEGGGAHGAAAGIAPKAAADLRDGQQAVAAADLDGDGAQEVVAVAKNGQVWALSPNPGGTLRLGLTVALPPGAAAGPLAVAGTDGKRPLGARVVGPGQPAFFGKQNRGAVRIEWSAAGAKATRTAVVREPSRVELAPAGK